MKMLPVYIVSLALVVGGCASPELLSPRDGTVPDGVDLSGNWKIQAESARNQGRIRDAIRKTDGVNDNEVFGQTNNRNGNPSQTARRSRTRGGLVYVFLEFGEQLKITQTPHGLFISFDRSVVEEYPFGGVRLANVGEVEAQRTAGWTGDTLVIETLGRNRMKLTEKFRVIDGGSVLERTIILRSKALEEETLVQLFDRV